MALYEFYCVNCKKNFECLLSHYQSQKAPCPECSNVSSNKLFSCFWVGGQGDLRETTLHGCHEHYHGLPEKQKKDTAV